MSFFTFQNSDSRVNTAICEETDRQMEIYDTLIYNGQCYGLLFHRSFRGNWIEMPLKHSFDTDPEVLESTNYSIPSLEGLEAYQFCSWMFVYSSISQPMRNFHNIKVSLSSLDHNSEIKIFQKDLKNGYYILN